MLAAGVGYGEELARSPAVPVVAWDVLVGRTGEGDTFCSRTELRFRCRRAGVRGFADLQADGGRRVLLNGEDFPTPDLHRHGRLALPPPGDEDTPQLVAGVSYLPRGRGVVRG